MQIILWLIASIFLGIVFQSFGYFFLLLIGGVAVTVIKDNLSARLVKLQYEGLLGVECFLGTCIPSRTFL